MFPVGRSICHVLEARFAARGESPGIGEGRGEAAHGLLDAGADVAFLTRSGRLKGLLSAGLSKNAAIRAWLSTGASPTRGSA